MLCENNPLCALFYLDNEGVYAPLGYYACFLYGKDGNLGFETPNEVYFKIANGTLLYDYPDQIEYNATNTANNNSQGKCYTSQ